MGFTVTYQTDLPEDEHGDGATFEFMEGGVLKIGSNGKTFYIAPNIWHTVTAEPEHEPGRTKRGAKGGRAAVD